MVIVKYNGFSMVCAKKNISACFLGRKFCTRLIFRYTSLDGIARNVPPEKEKREIERESSNNGR
jgi:hypothetical protein